MKTFIPKQPKHIRERIEAKLDARLVERLEKYCLYLESDRDYVLAQALQIIFRKDRGFATWLASQEGSAPAVARSGNPHHAIQKPQTSEPTRSLSPAARTETA